MQVIKAGGKNGLSHRIYALGRFITTPLFQVEEMVPEKGRIIDLGCGTGIYRSSEVMKSLLEDIGFRVQIDVPKFWLPYPHIMYVCEK